jgi:hypothetical protein
MITLSHMNPDFEISNRHAHMHLKRHQTNITPPGSQITKFVFTLFSILQNLPAAYSASHKLPQILQPKKKEKPNLDYVQNHELDLMQLHRVRVVPKEEFHAVVKCCIRCSKTIVGLDYCKPGTLCVALDST